MSLKPWLMAFRPKTLTAAVVPVVVGTAVVFAEGSTVHWSLSVYALLGALFIQIGTNLVNDALDFKKGADTEERLGPQRVTQSGLISARTVMIGASIVFLSAIVCGVPLVMRGGWVLVAIGVLSIFFAYAYTGGPFPLAYKGLGDFFVVIFFGLVAVGGVYYLHTLQFGWAPVVAGFQVGFLATVLIAVNNLRDVHQDKKVHKKTLAVRFGQKFVHWEILCLMGLSFLLLGYWAWQQLWLAALLPLVTLPLARAVLKGVIHTPPGPEYNRFLALSSALHLLFGIQLALGLVLL